MHPMKLMIIILLLLLSGVFSGLNLGLMSLSPHELKRKKELGDKRAAKIYPIRKDGNLLLVTLLLGNVAVNAILAVFLGSLTSGLVAVTASTLLITLFGEIMPQAFFSRYALQTGSVAVPLVKIILKVFYPVAKPIAYLLDKTLGHELPELYSRSELIKILEEHASDESGEIAAYEEKIARGALTFGDKTVEEIMTPRSKAHFVHAQEKITPAFIKRLQDSGYSRFPVLSKDEEVIEGMLYLRNLTGPLPADKTAGDLADKKFFMVREKAKLARVLHELLKSRRHLFVTVNEFGEVTGVVSIEDILEEIIGQEIVGEFDRFENLREVAEADAKTRTRPETTIDA